MICRAVKIIEMLGRTNINKIMDSRAKDMMDFEYDDDCSSTIRETTPINGDLRHDQKYYSIFH